MKLDLRSFVMGLFLAVTASCAGEYNGPGKSSLSGQSLKDKLTATVGQAPDDIRPAKAPGLMEARWGSNFAYITDDGRYVIFGDMLNLDTQEEITEGQRRGDRVQALAELGRDNTIEFAPESPKYTVTVFTDVDCGYCRMLHRQINEYIAHGIAIRYIFFPRTGPDTESFRKAEQVWCSADRKAALTTAKNGAELTASADCPNPVRREWDMGVKFGVHGTPMLVLPNGETLPGYVPPDQLSARLVAMDHGKVVGKN